MNGLVGQDLHNPRRAGVGNDGSMCSHKPIVHYALSHSKRLLHYSAEYLCSMDTPNKRLKHARIEAGFETAVEAAAALGIPVSTYIGHENGRRGFPAKRAPIYGRRFRVSPEWLLYGRGQMKTAELGPTEVELEAMLESAQLEIGLSVAVSGWSRAVASSLRTQLEQYLADRVSLAPPAAVTSRDKGAPPREPTNPGVQE